MDAISFQDPDWPFRIEATLGEWQTVPGSPETVQIPIASGVMHDMDKGEVPISGVVAVFLRKEDGSYVPVEVLHPGNLSELQQAGVLEAVLTHLKRS